MYSPADDNRKLRNSMMSADGKKLKDIMNESDYKAFRRIFWGNFREWM
ncbi:MAG: hypothetical protein U5M51_09920 [Emticicia sp.]|nr:hypothetical protein [Emticicia sp.]